MTKIKHICVVIRQANTIFSPVIFVNVPMAPIFNKSPYFPLSCYEDKKSNFLLSFVNQTRFSIPSSLSMYQCRRFSTKVQNDKHDVIMQLRKLEMLLRRTKVFCSLSSLKLTEMDENQTFKIITGCFRTKCKKLPKLPEAMMMTKLKHLYVVIRQANTIISPVIFAADFQQKSKKLRKLEMLLRRTKVFC